jgi:hypothetical protein
MQEKHDYDRMMGHMLEKKSPNRPTNLIKINVLSPQNYTASGAKRGILG